MGSRQPKAVMLALLAAAEASEGERVSRHARQDTGMVINRVLEQELTLLPKGKLEGLVRLMGMTLGVPGDVVEVGVYRGGSALVLNSCMPIDRRLFLADSFEGSGAPGQNDYVRGEQSILAAGSYCAGLDGVRANFARIGSGGPMSPTFYRGWIEDSDAYFQLYPATIAFLHIDVDLEAAHRILLKHLYPRVSVGGVIVFDDGGRFVGAGLAIEDFACVTGETTRETTGEEQRYWIKGTAR